MTARLNVGDSMGYSKYCGKLPTKVAINMHKLINLIDNSVMEMVSICCTVNVKAAGR